MAGLLAPVTPAEPPAEEVPEDAAAIDDGSTEAARGFLSACGLKPKNEADTIAALREFVLAVMGQ